MNDAYAFYNALRPLSDIGFWGSIIVLVMGIIIYIFPSKEDSCKRRFKDFCKELNINKTYIKRLKNEYCYGLFNSSFKIECDRDYKEKIMYYYIIMVITDIRLDTRHNFDYNYFDYYSNNHKEDISKLKILLEDYHYKHNAFLFQNIICLAETLKEPFKQIDNIQKLDLPDSQRNNEISNIENKIFETFDIFFEMVLNLYNERNSEKDIIKPISTNSGMFYDLEKYKELLINIQDDINNQKAIF